VDVPGSVRAACLSGRIARASAFQLVAQFEKASLTYVRLTQITQVTDLGVCSTIPRETDHSRTDISQVDPLRGAGWSARSPRLAQQMAPTLLAVRAAETSDWGRQVR
jgi:hypothetical protein